MEIVIFAAGLGSRLGENKPKILVEIINGKSLLEFQLEAISQIFPGVPVHIIGGYRYNLLQTSIEKLNWKKNPIHLHFNPFYECGIIGTAWVASTVISDTDIIRIDGDVYFSADTLDSLKNVNNTTFLLSNVENEKTTAVAEIDFEGCLKSISIVKNYIGPHEWICIERFLNDDYQKIISNGIFNCPLSSYFYELVNIQTDKIKIDTKIVNDVYEIDTYQDLTTCRDFLDNCKCK